mmetsp:Transcript_45003/g.67769  ORF Transcript_45003/g.67769 Transcript_45003/m.67769 type:complete len:470 (-) Transcript_45003:581-1990(-)
MLIKGVMHDFGKKTEGYRPHDLKVVASRARQLSHIRALGRGEIPGKYHGERSQFWHNVDPLIKLERDVSKILSSYTPLSHQRVRLKKTSFTDWSSIGGLFRAKEKLTEIVMRPIKYSLLYNHAPVALPRGILLFGPPGCGKSYLVPALAKECNLNLVTCNGPELLDKYIGASEAKVRDLFAQAEMASPAILFLDEFDALAPRRGTDHTGVTDRVVNQLLTFLDGVENVGKKGSVLYIIAATSRPDKIDPALLRPGRLESHVYVGYPESAFEWNDIFLSISKQRDIDEEVKTILTSGEILLSVNNLFPHAKMFSGADMKGVFDTAHLNAIHEYLKSKDCKETPNTIQSQHEDGYISLGKQRVCAIINKHHLFLALKSTRPSLSTSDRNMFRHVFGPFLKTYTTERNYQAESLQTRNNSNTLAASSSTCEKEDGDLLIGSSCSYGDFQWADMHEHYVSPFVQNNTLRTTLH